MTNQHLRSLLTAATFLSLTAMCSVALAGSKTMLDVQLQLDNTYSGTVSGTVLVFKDANKKVIATCAPDASVFASSGRMNFDCAVSGSLQGVSSAKFVSDQVSQSLQFGVNTSGAPALGNYANYAVGSLYAFDIDGTEPEFFDIDGTEPEFFDIDGTEPEFFGK
jgi:hypothetical protein